MAKVILKGGEEEFLSPGEARKKVASGEATFPSFDGTYTTRQMKAEVKPKRKRRTKAEIEADEAAAESAKDAEE